MTKMNLIILKILGIGLTVLFGYSLLWISMMYLYGWLYQPINDTKLEKIIPFELVVILISMVVILLIFFKLKKNGLKNLILQDVGLIIFSFPFYGTVLELFGIGLDDNVEKFNPFVAIIILTILTLNLNDWKKI